MKKLIIIIAFCIPMSIFAQSSNLGNWLIYIGSKKLDNKWNLHHEVQYRNYNAIGDLEQLLLRTGIGYNVADNSNLLLGYGYIHSHNYINNTDDYISVNEHRIFQQFITRQKLGRLSLQHRYRLEERWVEEDFKVRFRYFMAFAFPLSNRQLVDHTFYLSSYNEIFLNAKSTVFDRNRLYFGLGYKLNNSVKFELGYMNQFLNGANRDQVNLITFANF